MIPASTARIEFRRWSLSDAELGMRLWGNADVMRYIGGPYSKEEVSARLEREVANDARYGVQYWPVFIDGEFAGACGIKPSPEDDTIFEMGFHFLPAFWGAGYASEASRAVMAFATDILGLDALYAGHHPENAVSRRLLTRLGFVEIGVHFFARTGLQHPWLRASLPVKLR
ncbi:MAG TPA: GNAT family N-acetyltransferase [Thermoanaerobaculia bacterium]